MEKIEDDKEEQKRTVPLADDIYNWAEPYAGMIKVCLQMAVGIIVAALLFIRGLLYLNIDFHIPYEPSENPLELVGKGLMISAGFELAYMLFTKGPDEAIEPVILGIAATTLIIASRESFELNQALMILVLSVSIGLLFFVRSRFLGQVKR